MRTFDVLCHLLWIIIHALRKYYVEYPDQFLGYYHQLLHLLKRILLSSSIIVMQFSELIVLCYQGHCNLE